jgi:hypothetical protein
MSASFALTETPEAYPSVPAPWRLVPMQKALPEAMPSLLF